MTSDFDVRESDRIRYCLDASLLSRKMYKTALDSYGGGHLRNVTEDEIVSWPDKTRCGDARLKIRKAASWLGLSQGQAIAYSY